MPLTPLDDKVCSAAVAEILKRVPEAVEIWLHGSRARGVFKRTSDWDFVVFVPDDGRISANRALNGLRPHRDGGYVVEGRKVDIQAEPIGSLRRIESRQPDSGEPIDSYLVHSVWEEGIKLWESPRPQPTEPQPGARAMTDTLVDIRFPYPVTGTVGRSRKTIVATGIETVKVQTASLEESPLAFVVEREFDRESENMYRRFHGLDRNAPVPPQRFEYRVVGGALMRGLVLRDGSTPLTLDALAKYDSDFAARDDNGNLSFYYWNDFPSPKPETVDLTFEGKRDATEVAADLRKIDDDGRMAAHAELLAFFDKGVRVVDGRLFQLAPPPCWTLARERIRQGGDADTLEAHLAVLDFDFPDILTPLGETRFLRLRVDDPLMPFALVGDHQKDAVRHAVTGAERSFSSVDRLEVHVSCEDFDAGLDSRRLRLLRDYLDFALKGVPWSNVPLGLRGTLAVLQEALELGCFTDGLTDDRLGQVRLLLERLAPQVDRLNGVIGSYYVEILKKAAEVVPLTFVSDEPQPDDDFSAFSP